MSVLRIGTRGSRLALWQTRHVIELLRRQQPALTVTEHILETEGDRTQGEIVASGAVGVFVKRIEQALTDGEIDLAVHSLKDMPTEQPEGLTVAAVPERHDARDTLVSAEGWTLDELPEGTRVGTGSPRRRAQLLHHRPDLEVVPVRGNVDTRIRKLVAGEFGALVLAAAGLERLGLDEVPCRHLEIDVCMPAVGQGALAVELRSDDARTREVVASLNHEPSRAAVDAERSLLRRLGGGCLAPAAAHARITAGRMHLAGLVCDPDGRALLMEQESGAVEDGEVIGARLADRLLTAGARAVLQAIRHDRV
jgi:hydroxymethylbilane synthase